MPMTAADAVLQRPGIAAFHQHVFIIVRFEKGGMTLGKMPDEVIAYDADVGEDADTYRGRSDGEAIRVGGIVILGQGFYRQTANGDRRPGIECPHEVLVRGKTALIQCGLGDVHRKLITMGKHLQTADMVIVLMGNKDSPYPGQRETHASHAPFRLTAGKADVDEDSFLLVTNIVTIAVATGIKRCDE